MSTFTKPGNLGTPALSSIRIDVSKNARPRTTRSGYPRTPGQAHAVRMWRVSCSALAQQVESFFTGELAGLCGAHEVREDLNEADGLFHVGEVSDPFHDL
jgi:hypothetical protein